MSHTYVKDLIETLGIHKYMKQKLLSLVAALVCAFSLSAQPIAFVTTNSLQTVTWGAFNVLDLTASTSIESATIDATTALTTPSLTVGGGLAITKILSTAATIDIGAVLTNTVATVNMTVTGAGTNGVPFLQINTPDTNCTYSAYISATNTVTVRAANISLNDIADHAITSARVIVFQP
jgi:hypothetical protein